MKDVRFDLTPKQTKAFDYLTTTNYTADDYIKAILFGGAKERISKSLEAVPFGDDIDWNSTKAFVGPGSYGVGAYVNLHGYFPNGTVEPGAEEESVKDEIIKAIGGLKLPDGRNLAAFAASFCSTFRMRASIAATVVWQ